MTLYRCRNYGHRFHQEPDGNNPTKPVICPTCMQDDFAARYGALPLDQSLQKWPLPTIGPST